VNIVARIWRLLDPAQRRQLVRLQFVSVAMAVSTVGGIAAVVPFFTALTGRDAIAHNGLLHALYTRLSFASEGSFVVALGIGFAAFVLLANAINLLGTLAINRFAFHVGDAFFVRLFDGYLRRDYSFHSQNNSASLASKVLHETGRVSTGILQQGLILVANVVTIVFVVISVLLLNPLVAGSAMLALGACYAAIYAAARGRLLRNGRNESRHFAARNQVVSETFGAIKEVTVSQARGSFVQRFAEQCRSMAKVELSTLAISLSPRNVLECLTVFCLVAVALYLRASSDGVGPWVAQLSFVALAAYRLLPSLQLTFIAVVRIRANLSALDNIEADLLSAASPQLPALTADRSWQGRPRRQIELHEISFRYAPDRPPAIANLSLLIQAGSATGLIGSNGSGKTTLVDVLAGLLLPLSGRVEVDGVTLDQATRTAWQATIAYVPQHVFLLDATIAENIALGVARAEIDPQRLDRAIRMARLTECVGSFTDGWDAMLGERGCRLSGGQRQRLGIARALYRDASVLILDEATSSLDGAAEEEIVDMLETLRPARTLIMIAHRLSALRHCDVIHEIREGRIARSSSYGEFQLPPRVRVVGAQ
jgi:ABC-type multidrug transport system fused ATPase/permease subunit